MKLYATTTSERASKGQGGNEYLSIDILVGDKRSPFLLGKVRVEHRENIVKPMGTAQSIDGYVIAFKAYEEAEEKVLSYILDDSEQLKGKKQKDEGMYETPPKIVHN